MRKLPANDAFCSTREAAERLGVALRTIQVWVENGVLPAWKTAGGHRRIARHSLEKLFAERAMIAGEPGQSNAVQPSASQLPVLAVDDEADLIRLYELHIGSWQLPVKLTTASDGFQGLVQVGQLAPQMLILDLVMPNMDGFQLIESLRSMPQSKGMEIVVVSGMSPAEITRRGGLPKAVKLLRKPIQFPMLRKILEARCRKLGILPVAPPKKREPKAAGSEAAKRLHAAKIAVAPDGRPWRRRATDR